MWNYTKAILHTLSLFPHRWQRTLPPRRKVESGPHPFPPPHTGSSGNEARVEDGRLHPFVAEEASKDCTASATDSNLKIIDNYKKNSINWRTQRQPPWDDLKWAPWGMKPSGSP